MEERKRSEIVPDPKTVPKEPHYGRLFAVSGLAITINAGPIVTSPAPKRSESSSDRSQGYFGDF